MIVEEEEEKEEEAGKIPLWLRPPYEFWVSCGIFLFLFFYLINTLRYFFEYKLSGSLN